MAALFERPTGLYSGTQLYHGVLALQDSISGMATPSDRGSDGRYKNATRKYPTLAPIQDPTSAPIMTFSSWLSSSKATLSGHGPGGVRQEGAPWVLTVTF